MSTDLERSNSADDPCSPGSHPHSDQPNWRPAETIDEYLRNCRGGLEKYSERHAAKLMGVSRIALWRWKRIGELPSGLLEHILQKGGLKEVSVKALAQVSVALRRGNLADMECCPRCGHVLRRRARVSDDLVSIVNEWIAEPQPLPDPAEKLAAAQRADAEAAETIGGLLESLEKAKRCAG
jgi:hypothetical protein